MGAVIVEILSLSEAGQGQRVRGKRMGVTKPPMNTLALHLAGAAGPRFPVPRDWLVGLV